VSCKNGKGGVLALRERVTRQRQYAIIPDLKAATVLPVLRAMLLAWPEAYRKSLTFDNGSEFCTSEMSKLEGFFPGLSIYYTDAYAAWQKGAVENSNEELRWYFPKGTDFAKVSPHHLRNEIARLNRKPMKCNGWKSSQELFDKLAA
jgi:IS30 family transposase